MKMNRRSEEMPLLKIDVLKGRTEEEIKCLMDAVHEIVLDVFQVPEGDRYQIMTQHEPYVMTTTCLLLSKPKPVSSIIISYGSC